MDQETLLALLREARDAQATDLHLKVPGPPRLRIDGQLVATRHPPLRPEDTFQAALAILQLARKEMPLATVRDEEVAFGVQRIGRFRAHLYRQRGTLGIAVHRMAFDVPTLEDLGANPALGERTWAGPGLTLVTGSSGRFAVFAALVDAFNRAVPGHLVSIERPLEYLHRDDRASIAQREVPVDTPTFAAGLRSCLTSDCDAVVVSELPDAECADLALRLAEGGLPVVAGLPGTTGREAVRAFTLLFPERREREVLERLGASLRRVVEYSPRGLRVYRPDTDATAHAAAG